MQTIHEYLDPIYNAINTDLSEIKDVQYGRSATDKREITRHPYFNEIEVYSFPQTWGSTALGFGGIGGSAMTTAQTVVVICGREACVYFGGTLAYKVECNNTLFTDIAAHNMASVRESTKYNK